MSGLDLGRARVTFRDRSISDVLDLALRFVSVERAAYAKVGAAVLVPLAALSLGVGWVFGWAWSWLVAIPLALVAEVPFTLLASRLVFAARVDARDLLRAALGAAPRVAALRIACIALVILGLFFFFVPGLWVGAIVLFLPEVILLEQSRVGPAFGRSQRIVSSALSETTLGLFVLSLLPLGSVLLSDVAGRAIASELLQLRPPQAVWKAGGSALATLGLFAVVPYVATARLMLYLDVRTRAEGWDIQTQFAAIARRTGRDGRENAPRIGQIT